MVNESLFLRPYLVLNLRGNGPLARGVGEEIGTSLTSIAKQQQYQHQPESRSNAKYLRKTRKLLDMW